VSHFYAWVSLDLDPPIHTFCIAGMTGVYHHAQLFIGWDGVLKTFLPRLASNCYLPDHCSNLSFYDCVFLCCI
jgi:hypothetical protein